MDAHKQQMFTDRYQAEDTPWDTGITPPEIVAITAELDPGKALDLGCGTGTNVRYLLEHGWKADGVDFVAQAIDTARQKLAGYSVESYSVFCHDVTRLDEIAGLRSPYDLAIDIGCGHSIPPGRQGKYAHDLAALLMPGGVFMLYTHHPRPESDHGWSPADVRRIFLPHFDLVWEVLSDDTTTGAPSGWYRLSRRSDLPGPE